MPFTEWSFFPAFSIWCCLSFVHILYDTHTLYAKKYYASWSLNSTVFWSHNCCCIKSVTYSCNLPLQTFVSKWVVLKSLLTLLLLFSSSGSPFQEHNTWVERQVPRLDTGHLILSWLSRWWWKHHFMRVLLSNRERETCQISAAKYRGYYIKPA